MECNDAFTLTRTLMWLNSVYLRLWIVVETSINLCPIFSIRCNSKWNSAFSSISFQDRTSDCVPCIVWSIIDSSIQLAFRNHIISETCTLNYDVIFLSCVVGTTSWIDLVYWEDSEGEVVIVIIVAIKCYLNTHFITFTPTTNWLAHDVRLVYVDGRYYLGWHW